MLASQRNPLDELSLVAPRMAFPHSSLNSLAVRLVQR